MFSLFLPLFLLAGCVAFDQRPPVIPLPEYRAQMCCHQALYELEVADANSVSRLTMAVALTPESLELAVLDTSTRRMFSINQQGKNISIEHELSSDISPSIILAAYYLAWWPLEFWLELINDRGVIKSTPRSRLILRNGETQIVVNYSDSTLANEYLPLKSVIGDSAKVTFVQEEFTVTFTPRSVVDL
jgi:hypothetical protein